MVLSPRFNGTVVSGQAEHMFNSWFLEPNGLLNIGPRFEVQNQGREHERVFFNANIQYLNIEKRPNS